MDNLYTVYIRVYTNINFYRYSIEEYSAICISKLSFMNTKTIKLVAKELHRACFLTNCSRLWVFSTLGVASVTQTKRLICSYLPESRVIPTSK